MLVYFLVPAQSLLGFSYKSIRSYRLLLLHCLTFGQRQTGLFPVFSLYAKLTSCWLSFHINRAK